MEPRRSVRDYEGPSAAEPRRQCRINRGGRGERGGDKHSIHERATNVRHLRGGADSELFCAACHHERPKRTSSVTRKQGAGFGGDGGSVARLFCAILPRQSCAVNSTSGGAMER